MKVCRYIINTAPRAISQPRNLLVLHPKESWKDEARNFTPWLANEGLTLLSETLGVELELIDTESRTVVNTVSVMGP